MANSSMTVDDTLFKTASIGGTIAFGTTSTDANIHSHYLGTEAPTSDYRYTGRMYITDSGGGIGVTFYSDYPNSDTYYRLRRYGTGSSASFHLNSHGATVEGSHDTGVVPSVNTWYRFIVEVEDVGTGTAIRVKVWEDNTTEPANWQIDTVDSSSPLTNGTVGLWAYNNGSKYWDDLAVAPLNSSQPTPTPTNTPAPGSTATPTNTPAATSTPTATPDPSGVASIQRSSYAIAGQAVALRVVEKDANGVELTNTLYYFHTDHLGSNSAMSDSSGALVAGSTARFTPFGSYRTPPTADLTNCGYTGHKDNAYINIDDSLGEKDKATRHIQAVDWHYDHSESTKNKPRYKNGFCYLVCTMRVGNKTAADVPHDVRAFFSKRHPRAKALSYFMSTELSCSTKTVLQGYSWRWSCEVVNFCTKSQLGLADFRVRSYEAVDRYMVVVHLSWVYVEQLTDYRASFFLLKMRFSPESNLLPLSKYLWIKRDSKIIAAFCLCVSWQNIVILFGVFSAKINLDGLICGNKRSGN